MVYHNDASARADKLFTGARLHYHQQHSQPVMEQLHDWLKRQFDDKLVEPNSALGGAIRYMQNHWQKLTLFLRQAGRASGQQCVRAGTEEGHLASQECSLLQDAQWLLESATCS